ncbi:hypothetical protein, partial [Kaarinaea lacus]
MQGKCDALLADYINATSGMASREISLKTQYEYSITPHKGYHEVVVAIAITLLTLSPSFSL